MRCVGTKKRSTRSNKETDGKGRSCRACSGITLIPAGPSTASDPPRPLNPKRTNDVLRKPDNCKSYGQRNQRHTESKAYQQLYEILARFLNLELLHDARSQW